MTTLPDPNHRRQKVLSDAIRLLLRDTQRRVDAGVRSPGTLAMQRQHARYLVERLGAAYPLRRLTERKIAAVLEAEAKGRRQRADGEVRQLSGGTVRKRASTLRRALLLSAWRGWLAKVPRFPEIPYEYTPRAEHLAAFEDYEQLRDALELRRRLWFVVAVWTGQRYADIERMRREDLDLAAAEPWMLVRSQKTRKRTGPGVRVHAPPELVRELADHWRQLPAGAKLVEHWPHVSGQLARLSARLGLPLTTAQRLRHTFFTWYVAANGFNAELLALGGWKSLDMPARVYAHAAPARFRAQIERTARLAQRTRRGPKKAPIVVGAVPNHDSGGTTPARVAPPKPARVGPSERERDGGVVGSSPTPAIIAAGGDLRRVGAERIELSTNGLRVRSAAPVPSPVPGPSRASPEDQAPWRSPTATLSRASST